MKDAKFRARQNRAAKELRRRQRLRTRYSPSLAVPPKPAPVDLRPPQSQLPRVRRRRLANAVRKGRPGAAEAWAELMRLEGTQ